jgi:hypothetical protein
MNSRTSVMRVLGAGALGLFLAACPQMPPVTDDSGVDAGSCEGTVGCACANGACTTGECVGGTCTDCRRGEASCICRSNGTCNAGLRCEANSCVTCPPGELNCACNTGDTCNAGLACASGTCVTDTCVAGSANCPCRPGDPKCDGTDYCDGTNVCRACSDDVVGCPCSTAGTCSGQAVCDATSMRCRAPRTCADLVAANQCGQNQACTEMNGADAMCQPMTCQPQFKWDGTQCVACVSLDCAAEPTCEADGGLSTTCATQNRACVQMGNVATCGGCLPGYTLNASNQCVTVPTCGTVTCTIDQYCDRTGGSATCQALPCPAGQARGLTGVCSACANPVPNCTGAGFSGRVWPFRTLGNEACICETLDNFYLPPGNAQSAVLCDADGDGWVREEAGDVSVTGDPALSANARCTISRPTRVRLVDEYGMSIDVLSCTEGLLKASVALADGGTPNGGLGLFPDGGPIPLADGGTACTGLIPLRMLEKQINDIPGRPMGTTSPAYGGASGRLLEAAELNTLTKACVTETADYNANGAEDINERQTIVNTPNDRQRLESFSFFLELHTAYVEGDALVIRERSRCGADFPVRYDPAADVANPVDLYSTATDTPYWRTCSRSRDPNYNQANLAPSMDFAHWSCSDTANTCPVVPPPHGQLVAPTDSSIVLLRNHGLCELNGGLPLDGRWRGMTHHSQFKCVSVQNSPAPPTGFVTTDFGAANNLLTLNTCVARPCTTPGDPACTTAQGAGKQTRRPVVECKAKAVAAVGDVGFAAVNYRPYRRMDVAYSPNTTYLGGCVNEDDLADTYLCPYPEFSLNKAAADSNFGRYSCYGRGSNFLWCGTPCNPARSTLRWGANSNMSVLR